jgi:hypothetical protein
MTKLDEVIEELRSLPANELTRFIHLLRVAGSHEDRNVLGQSASRLTAEEAAELEKIIEVGYEQVDEREW